ncbi:MAG: hypothetical protein SWK76_02225, partial [Actinomycetota bacterium]|nr:hypothetical protein [Actinomycetota bacterium]
MLRLACAVLLALAVVGVLAAPGAYASSYPWPGGHDSPGVTSPSERWYFAEGCTRSGFDTWLCVANPGDDTA